MLSALILAWLVQDPPATREERVLALLQDVHRSGSYRYGQTVFERVAPPLGEGPVLVPQMWIMCGNSDSGTFDDVRVRDLALEVCAAYGLAMETRRREADGEKSVVLDGLDPRAGIGFELRGNGCHETFCEGPPEDETAKLDEAEFSWLTQRGLRIHVADVAAYRSYEDAFTPTLAYLASLVMFLNDLTDGDDVELGGLLFEREAVWWPRFVSGDGVTVHSTSGQGRELPVERATTLALQCRGLPDFENAPDRDPMGFWETPEQTLERRQFGSTLGAASVVYIQGEALGVDGRVSCPEFPVRIRQELDGVELVRESRSLAVFLPRSFDLALPFELELELAPGRYVLYGPRIGAAAPR